MRSSNFLVFLSILVIGRTFNRLFGDWEMHFEHYFWKDVWLIGGGWLLDQVIGKFLDELLDILAIDFVVYNRDKMIKLLPTKVINKSDILVVLAPNVDWTCQCGIKQQKVDFLQIWLISFLCYSTGQHITNYFRYVII